MIYRFIVVFIFLIVMYTLYLTGGAPGGAFGVRLHQLKPSEASAPQIVGEIS